MRAKGFSIPISGVKFLNNVSIPDITWYNLEHLLTISLKDKSFYNSIEQSGLYL